ncbi:uncharacterized protein LOC121792620 [Salvia splendens]|uniref:uncharacterized protein LOC121792620 n=1 Tax=Salvia splendens TaxID=180675 RepID=UPI001C263F06|nr:uncharacterized protein LOC121792620 [Salvia splendens]
MQAIKDKITDMKELHKAKAEAREVEKAERQDAKARLAVVHHVTKARKAEAAMDYHVQKAAEKAEEVREDSPSGGAELPSAEDLEDSLSYSQNSSSAPPSHELYSGGAPPDSGHDKAAFVDVPFSPHTTAPPSQNNRL